MTARSILMVSAAAFVAPDGSILVQQRPPGGSLAGLWEFPGGKIEPGETPEAALIREVREELGLEVAPEDLSPAGFASASLGERHLVMLVYLCRSWRGEPRALHASALQWCNIEALATLPMPPADAPLIPLLAALL